MVYNANTIFGIYCASTKKDAIDAMARDAEYADYADLCARIDEDGILRDPCDAIAAADWTSETVEKILCTCADWEESARIARPDLFS